MPIPIDVRDAKGKSVYRNDIPGSSRRWRGAAAAAGRRRRWVNDQVAAAGKPAGRGEGRRSAGTVAGAAAQVDVSAPKLEGIPSPGSPPRRRRQRSGEDQRSSCSSRVARRGGRWSPPGAGAIDG